MHLKFLYSLLLVCLLSFSSQAQDKKAVVADKPAETAAYKKWVKRDAAYIITKEEKEAYEKLETNAERENFIENFWLRRDPTPATEVNEFRTEYYERIAYANEHFASGIPGWMTDRGRVYIVYGKPDKIEKGRAKFENYENILFEKWSYKYLNNYCSKTEFTFYDPTETGEFRMAVEQRDKILQPPAGLVTCWGE